MMIKAAFLANLFTTLFMVGLIWMVQVVHYPLFAKVGAEMFRSYHADHNLLISLVVMPAMLLEAATAGLLLLDRPAFMTPTEAWVGAGLVAVAWGATFFLAVPQHNALAGGFNVDAHRLLVTTNWVRTAVWTARGGLMVWLVAKLF